jgi:predicted transcriptional regulator YdeE
MAIRNVLMRLFAHNIGGIQPRIVDLEQPIKIIGMAVDTDMKRIYRDVPALGKQFRKFKQTHEIPSKKQPWAFAAVSKDFDEASGTFWYIMGDVVTSLDKIPAGLMSFEIPAIKYVVFPVRPKNRWGWGMAIANTKRYAYTMWLPNSEYEPAGVIDDFEYHDERSVRRSDPEIDLYVAIREKH